MIQDIKILLTSHNKDEYGIRIGYDLDEYLNKLYQFANIIPFYSCGVLLGFIAYYSNNTSGNAFLSMIIIRPEAQGNKIGDILLNASISDLKYKKFNTFSLEVLKVNSRAIKFYRKHGFEILKENGDFFQMVKIIL